MLEANGDVLGTSGGTPTESRGCDCGARVALGTRTPGWGEDRASDGQEKGKSRDAQWWRMFLELTGGWAVTHDHARPPILLLRSEGLRSTLAAS